MVKPKNSWNPAYPIVVEQAKLQPKDRMKIALPFRLTIVYRTRCACLEGGIIRGSNIHICLI